MGASSSTASASDTAVLDFSGADGKPTSRKSAPRAPAVPSFKASSKPARAAEPDSDDHDSTADEHDDDEGEDEGSTPRGRHRRGDRTSGGAGASPAVMRSVAAPRKPAGGVCNFRPDSRVTRAAAEARAAASETAEAAKSVISFCGKSGRSSSAGRTKAGYSAVRT